jgi:hypothetical protein
MGHGSKLTRQHGDGSRVRNPAQPES